MTPVLPAVLAGLCVALLVPGIAGGAFARAWSHAPSRSAEAQASASDGGSSLSSPRVMGLSLAAVWVLLFPSAAGAVVAALLGLGLPLFVAGMDAREQRAAERRVDAQAPEVLSLLVACLSAGGSLPEATSTVAESGENELCVLLRGVSAAIALGAPPYAAWLRVQGIPSLEPAVVAILRSERTGAPLAEGLLAVVTDSRQRRSEAALAAARSSGVRAVLPLGLCFLPAFVLVGVVPVVASMLQSIFGSR